MFDVQTDDDDNEQVVYSIADVTHDHIYVGTLPLADTSQYLRILKLMFCVPYFLCSRSGQTVEAEEHRSFVIASLQQNSTSEHDPTNDVNDESVRIFPVPDMVDDDEQAPNCFPPQENSPLHDHAAYRLGWLVKQIYTIFYIS